MHHRSHDQGEGSASRERGLHLGGGGLHLGGGGLLHREGICIQRGEGSASEGGEVLHPGKRGSASSGVERSPARTRKADSTHPS